MDVKKRISLIINEKGLNTNSFAKKIGVPQSMIYNIVGEKGRGNNPGLPLLEKISITFDVSPTWLLLGKGPRYLSDEEKLTPEERKNVYKKDPVPLEGEGGYFPMLDLGAVSRYPKQLLSKDFLRNQPRFYFPLPNLGDAMAFQVDGHAMEERIRHQDYVIGTHISDLELVESGNVYVVVTVNQVICRRLAEVDGGMLRFKSDNPDFGKKAVPVVGVKEIWWVRYVISGNMRSVRPLGEEMRPKLSKREFEHRRILGREKPEES